MSANITLNNEAFIVKLLENMPTNVIHAGHRAYTELRDQEILKLQIQSLKQDKAKLLECVRGEITNLEENMTLQKAQGVNWHLTNEAVSNLKKCLKGLGEE